MVKDKKTQHSGNLRMAQQPCIATRPHMLAWAARRRRGVQAGQRQARQHGGGVARERPHAAHVRRPQLARVAHLVWDWNFNIILVLGITLIMTNQK